jgi:ribosomal 30S subunit maturation factor RimM
LDAGNDTEKLKSCEELAKTHAENLPKDQESQKIYAEEIIRCAVYEQKDTK